MFNQYLCLLEFKERKSKLESQLVNAKHKGNYDFSTSYARDVHTGSSE